MLRNEDEVCDGKQGKRGFRGDRLREGIIENM